MPNTRGGPLPSELLDALKSPSVQAWLKTFIINIGSSSSIGRIPGFESAQNDQYVYPDDADVNFAYNFDYLIPSNFQRLVSAKLSFKIRAFRSYNNFSATATGNASNDHTHGMQNHTHGTPNHQHTVPINNNGGVPAGAQVFYDGVSLNANHTGGGEFTDNSGAGTTGGPSNNTTTGQSANHTHTVTINSTLGIFEDVVPNNPGITVAVDGTDVTAKLGGPFQVDQVEIDVTQVLKTGVKSWHVLSLQPNQRVRITGILRISYYVDSRLAQ